MPLIARDGERYVAHVLPLTSGARRRTGTSYAAAAALFVHKAALEAPSPTEAIAKAYDLTPRILPGRPIQRLSKRELDLHAEERLAFFNFLLLVSHSCPLGV